MLFNGRSFFRRDFLPRGLIPHRIIPSRTRLTSVSRVNTARKSSLADRGGSGVKSETFPASASPFHALIGCLRPPLHQRPLFSSRLFFSSAHLEAKNDRKRRGKGGKGPGQVSPASEHRDDESLDEAAMRKEAASSAAEGEEPSGSSQHEKSPPPTDASDDQQQAQPAQEDAPDAKKKRGGDENPVPLWFRESKYAKSINWAEQFPKKPYETDQMYSARVAMWLFLYALYAVFSVVYVVSLFFRGSDKTPKDPLARMRRHRVITVQEFFDTVFDKCSSFPEPTMFVDVQKKRVVCKFSSFEPREEHSSVEFSIASLESFEGRLLQARRGARSPDSSLPPRDNSKKEETFIDDPFSQRQTRYSVPDSSPPQPSSPTKDASKLPPWQVYYDHGSDVTMGGVLGRFLPVLLLIGASVYISRQLGSAMGGGGIFNIGKTNARVSPENVKTKLRDVAGLEEAKNEVMEFVDFLRRPEKYKKLGARVPKGALLVGPPGTGKTLLAKAVAGEAGVPFFSMSGSDFTEMFVGVGPARVRDLFKAAKSAAPCIIFLDEIDAVGRARSASGFAGNDERENTLNQLLVELDGFATDTGAGIIVLAGTNRADVLDRALLRPGRFDRQINVELPDVRGRKKIFLQHLRPLVLMIEKESGDGARHESTSTGTSLASVAASDEAEMEVEEISSSSSSSSAFSTTTVAGNIATDEALQMAVKLDRSEKELASRKEETLEEMRHLSLEKDAESIVTESTRAAATAVDDHIVDVAKRVDLEADAASGDSETAVAAAGSYILTSDATSEYKVVLAEKLAALTPGFSGADIANMCNEAAIIAARAEPLQPGVAEGDFDAALDRVVAGLAKQNRVLSGRERKIVAYHEAGHAIVGWFLEHCDPLLKVSIVPRGSGALGFAMSQPQDRAFATKEQLSDFMCMALGGRIAEALHFSSSITTGASDDLKKVTELAYSQVTAYGMSTGLGLLAFPESDENDLLSATAEKPYSQKTGARIDAEVRALVNGAYERTQRLLEGKREMHVRLAERLLSAEVLYSGDLVEILGPRPFAERRTYAELTADQRIVGDGNDGNGGANGVNEDEDENIDMSDRDAADPGPGIVVNPLPT